MRMQGVKCDLGVWSCLGIKQKAKGTVGLALWSPGSQWQPGCECWSGQGGGGGRGGVGGWLSGPLVLSAKGSKEVRRWGGQGGWDLSGHKGLPERISTWVWVNSRYKWDNTHYYICLDRRRGFKSRKSQGLKNRVEWRNLFRCERENVTKRGGWRHA